MEGPINSHQSERGVILRVAEQIVDTIEKMHAEDDKIEISVTGSYLEIYQENLRDLLDGENDKNLKIRIDPLGASGKELYVEGLSEVILSNISDYKDLISLGKSRRTVGETNMNEVSSRSHAVLTLLIKQYQKIVSVNEVGGMKTSKIHLIDLAGKFYIYSILGSERADSTGATGTRLKEGSAINQSLSSLGNVINALSTNSNYVPYRDSKLTYLLSDSLG